ncbi:MAG TPA: glycosyltransferase [Methylomirabilota bacterium]|jgi:D-inositol-3-phosphate glycosyltransferase|nr:glycosyltransferase [Methylomirabilota bacterium]
MTRLAFFSVHTCPLAALGGKETGGMNVYVRELARELGRLGFGVDVFTRSQDAAIPEVVPLGEGARVVHVRAGPARPLPRGALVPHLDAFADEVERFRRREGVEYALLHSHYWLSGLVALGLGRRWGRPVVHMFHTLGALKNSVARGGEDREPDSRIRAEERIASTADRIVAANLVERADLAWYCGADVTRVRVVPCGVDLDLFRPSSAEAARARLRLDAERVLLFVGRLAPIKGLETLLRALAAVKSNGLGRTDLRLVVVGGDKEETWNGGPARLRRLADQLGVGAAVDFRGPQPQDILPDYYAAADLCLMPSLYESFGMVALEAMACGVPVVGSRVGGLTVTVQDGTTGLLVPEGDVTALADGITGLLEDEERRRKLGAQAAEWARGFAWPCIARAVIELYAELVPGLLGAARRSRCPSVV